MTFREQAVEPLQIQALEKPAVTIIGVGPAGMFLAYLLVTKMEWAARIHRVPLDEFLVILRNAISSDSQGSTVKEIRKVEGKS